MSQNGDRRFPTVEALLNPKLQAAAAVVEGDFDTSNCPLSGGGGYGRTAEALLYPSCTWSQLHWRGIPPPHTFPTERGEMTD